MSIMNREDIIQGLREGVCQVTFTKKNGEERVMFGTLDFDQIPEDKRPQTDGNDADTADKAVNTEVVKVFDTEKGEWRSFRIDSLVEFKYK